MKHKLREYSLADIVSYLADDVLDEVRQGGEQLSGLETIKVTGLASLQNATAQQLTFLSNPKFADHLSTTQAAAVMIAEDGSDACSAPVLRVRNPYLAYAKVSALFDASVSIGSGAIEAGIHPSAVVHEAAFLAAGVSVGPNAVIAADANIGKNTVIGASCAIGAGTVIGADCVLNNNVTLYHDIVLADRVRLHSGCVIGSDGFGFAPKPDGGWQKIHQLGRVVVGSDVEIGANTTIDRGAIEDTVISKGVIIDNQVQIAHNVWIGENTAIAACVGIAGSTRIGKNCTIAGAVGIIGHLEIVDNVHVTAMSLVTNSIKEPGAYSGGTGLSPNKEWRRSVVRFGQLDSMAKRLRELEKQAGKNRNTE